MKQIYVLPKLIDYISTTTGFDLWVSKGANDIFVIVIKNLGFDWQPKQITIGLFETIETTRQTLANKFDKID